MQTTAEQIERAEAVLSAGDPAKGVPLLLDVLDRDPINVTALDDLVTASEAWPDNADKLLHRLHEATDRALDPQIVRKLRWWYLTCSIYFDRSEIMKGLLAKPEDIILGDAQRRSAIGALIAEMGQGAAGERMLEQAGTPLARYHLARLATDRGDAAAARQMLDTIKGDAGADMLRRVGLLQLDFQTKGGLKAAKDLLAERYRTEFDQPLPALVISEIKLLGVRVAVAEGRMKNAREEAQSFASPPYRADPSAMIRATKLTGVPLWETRR
jgi:hypothetical protein